MSEQETQDESLEETTSVDTQEVADEQFDVERAKAKIVKTGSENYELRKRLKAAESKLKGIEDAGKSELEKERETRLKLEAQLEAATTAQLRHQVAGDKGVPSNLVKFLSGTTQQELEESAAELLDAFGTGKPEGTDGKPTPKLKPSGRDSTDDIDNLDPGQLADRIYQKIN